jgi:hypothetical protein
VGVLDCLPSCFRLPPAAKTRWLYHSRRKVETYCPLIRKAIPYNRVSSSCTQQSWPFGERFHTGVDEPDENSRFLTFIDTIAHNRKDRNPTPAFQGAVLHW